MSGALSGIAERGSLALGPQSKCLKRAAGAEGGVHRAVGVKAKKPPVSRGAVAVEAGDQDFPSGCRTSALAPSFPPENGVCPCRRCRRSGRYCR